MPADTLEPTMLATTVTESTGRFVDETTLSNIRSAFRAFFSGQHAMRQGTTNATNPGAFRAMEQLARQRQLASRGPLLSDIKTIYEEVTLDDNEAATLEALLLKNTIAPLPRGKRIQRR